MTLPANISYGTVVGQYIASVGDGSDADKLPDALPMSGTVTFVASASRLLDISAVPNPVTIIKTQVTCQLDSEGYLCSPYTSLTSPLSRGVMLVATDNENLNPTGWTWQVLYNLRDPLGQPVAMASHSILVPSNQTIDLATVTPVADSGGTPILRGPAGPEAPIIYTIAFAAAL